MPARKRPGVDGVAFWPTAFFAGFKLCVAMHFAAMNRTCTVVDHDALFIVVTYYCVCESVLCAVFV